jgi:hypothetical protein
VSEHDLSCAMMPVCFLSGYYLVIDPENVIKLDRRGELLARGVLQKTKKQNDFRVTIRGLVRDAVLHVHTMNELE